MNRYSPFSEGKNVSLFKKGTVTEIVCVKKVLLSAKENKSLHLQFFYFSCNVSFSSLFFTVLKQVLITCIRAAFATHSFTMYQLAS